MSARISSRTARVFINGLAVLAWFTPFTGIAEESGDLDCVITPSATLEVSAAVAGVLEEVSVDRSDRVSKGQLLAQLDSGVELAELELARARAETNAIVNLRKTSLRFDRRTWKRLRSLHGDKLVSAEDKEDAEREAHLSNWRLQDAKDLLRQRELEQARAQQVLLRRQVFSPIDGIVVQRMRHPGEYVEDQPILRVAKIDPLYVEAIVPMSRFREIKRGMQAHVYSEIDPDQRLIAKVSAVDGIGDAASGTFGVRLSMPNTDHSIPAGVKCSLRLVGEQVAAGDNDIGSPEPVKGRQLSGVMQIDRR